MRIYNIPAKFILRLIRDHDGNKDNLKYFKALSDILIHSLKRQNTSHRNTLTRFFSMAFHQERQKFIDTAVEYPALYYELVNKSMEELALSKHRRDYALEARISGSKWLLGDMRSGEISNRTYYYLWQNKLLAIQYDNDDLIINHWQTAHQHISFNLDRIHPEYSKENNFEAPINQNEITKRETERERFLKFHYALGGLLTYNNKYECIGRCFTYTQSSPPDYPLLPNSMYEIFMFYANAIDIYGHSHFGAFSEYHFPGVEGMNSDNTKQKWIVKYLCILFLRQYKITPYLTTMRPLAVPDLKLEQAEMRILIESLDFFKRQLIETFNDELILKKLKLDFITSDWCKTNKKPYPLELMDEIIAHLKKSYESKAINAELDPEKVQQFYDISTNLIENTINNYSVINNTINDTNIENWYINGIKMLYSKDAFVKNPEAGYFDWDSFAGQNASISIKEGIASTFLYKTTTTYIIKYDQIFKAINELKINTDYVLVCFGINVQNFLRQFPTNALSEKSYDGIPIFEFESYGVVRSSVFVLKKVDLPEISTKDLLAELIKEYSLQNRGKTHKIYSSVLNLNTAADSVKEDIEIDEAEVGKSVILNLMFNLEVKWKKVINIVQLITYSQYNQDGILNELTDIKAIVETKNTEDKK